MFKLVKSLSSFSEANEKRLQVTNSGGQLVLPICLQKVFICTEKQFIGKLLVTERRTCGSDMKKRRKKLIFIVPCPLIKQDDNMLCIYYLIFRSKMNIENN